MAIATVDEIDSPALVTVSASESLSDAIEMMLSRNFSQLGLVRDDELVGVVSFQSIARFLLVTEEVMQSPTNLGDRAIESAIEKPRNVQPDNDIDDLFDLLGERSYVLVEDETGLEKSEVGMPYRIITDYDIREFWRESTEPFLLIEETEVTIREIIATVYG